MIRKILNVAGVVADRALNALAPIELRHMDYLTALNGKPVFDHDSVQLAANKLADEQLADLELDLEDARAEADNHRMLLVAETATKASLAKELHFAMQEVNDLRSELDEARARIQELEES